MKLLRNARFVLAIIVLLVAAQQVVEASHFRGGTMSVRVSPTGTLTVTTETLWRKGGDAFTTFPLSGVTRLGIIQPTNPAGPFPAGFPIDLQILDAVTRTKIAGTFDATLPLPDIVGTTTSVDTSDPAFDIRRQQFTIDLVAVLAPLELGHGDYILYWVDGGRIAGLQNVASDVFVSPATSQSPFSLEARFTWDGTQRDTPTISSRVLTTVVRGQVYNNNLNAAGAGALTYQLLLGSTGPRYAPTSQIPGLTVDSTGQVSIPAINTGALVDVNPAGEPGGDYVFKVQITDALGQYIEQDVMLDVQQAVNQACGIIVSDAASTVSVGETLVLTLTATDPDAGDNLTISNVPVLANSSLSATVVNPGPPATWTASWTFTPDLSQIGTHGVNFTADDNGAPPLQCVVNAQITVDAPTADVPVSAAGEEVPGVASNSKTGSALAGCGDIFTVAGGAMNLGDLFAGAPGFEDPFAVPVVPVEAGAAVLYFGSTVDTDLVSPDVFFTGTNAHDRAGTSVSCGFSMDLNGIPAPVLIIGAEQVDRISDPAVPTANGKVYVILFDPSDYPNINDPLTPDIVSLSRVGSTLPDGIPGWVFEGEHPADEAGFCVAGGCQLNVGSTEPEIIIGAPGGDNISIPLADTGVVYVVFGEDAIFANPFSGASINLNRVAGTASPVAGVRYQGDQAGAQLGFACACVGDVVGDFNEDLAMSAPFHDVNPPKAGVVYVPDGGDQTSGIIETCEIGTSTTGGSQIQGDQTDENMGTSISAGSLILGSPFYDPDASRVDAGRVIRATAKLPDGILSASSIGDPDPGNPDSQPGAIYHGAEAGDGLGVAVAGLFDVTNDGIPDFAMGAPFADINPTDAGKTYVVAGTGDTTSTQGIIETCDIGTDVGGRQLDGSQTGEQSGSTIANTGDMNGNPSNDFAIGAPFKDVLTTGVDAGTLYLVLESNNLVRHPPVANAGPDQIPACIVGPTLTALLDGSASTDEDSTPGTNDDIVSFVWSRDGAPPSSGEQVSVVFAPGVHEILLTVTDSSGVTATDTMIVTACSLTLDLEKVEIDWPKPGETLAEVKIHGTVALPDGILPAEVVPLGSLTMDIAGQPVLAESLSLNVFGSDNNKWDFKSLPPGLGISQFAIHWDGANFDYKDVVRLKTEFIGLTETALSVSQDASNHVVVLAINGITATIVDGVCTVDPLTVPCEIDEDGEATVTLPFELLPEMQIVLTIGTWAPSIIPVADHYTAAGGKFKLDATVDPLGLTGDSLATMALRMTLGADGFPGSVGVSEAEWKKLSTKEWKAELKD